MPNSVKRANGLTNFTLKQGSTFEHELTITVNGVGYDLTNFDCRMTIRRASDDSILWNGNLANSKLVKTAAVQGKVKFIISAADFSSVVFDPKNKLATELECVYDLDIVSNANGNVFTPMEGTIVFTREWTRGV